MACTGLQQSLDELQSGNATMDGIKQIISNCPRICDFVYGTDKPFELAGPGVQLSFFIQAVLVVLFGTLQSFISYIMSPHASSSTQLFTARLQLVFDKITTSIVILYIATLVTSFIRLRSGPDAFERITIQKLLEHVQASVTLALVARIVQKDPPKVKLTARRWNLAALWGSAQALPIIGAYVKSMSGGLPSTVLSRLCAATHSEDKDLGVLGYPTVTTPPSGNSFLLMTIATMVVMIVICAAVNLIRNRFLAWLKKVFTARLTLVVGVALWTVSSLAVLGADQWMLIYLQRTMSNAKSAQVGWDFGQIVAVGLWAPVFYRLLLTFLVCLKPKTVLLPDDLSIKDFAQALCNLYSSIIEDLYESNTGGAPRVEQDTDSKEKETQKSPPKDCKPHTPEAEKAALANLEETEPASRRIKSILANGTYNEASQEDKELIADIAKAVEEEAEQDKKDEKASLMQILGSK